MTPAERRDVATLLMRLASPCPPESEHDWSLCLRCLTLEELAHRRGRVFDLLRLAADEFAEEVLKS